MLTHQLIDFLMGEADGIPKVCVLLKRTDRLSVHYAFGRKRIRAELLEAWLALTSVKYHDNLLILMVLN